SPCPGPTWSALSARPRTAPLPIGTGAVMNDFRVPEPPLQLLRIQPHHRARRRSGNRADPPALPRPVAEPLDAWQAAARPRVLLGELGAVPRAIERAKNTLSLPW